MGKPTMSKEALNAKHYYHNVVRWENKAKKLYGKDYKPAEAGEEISAQALELRRAKARDYRKSHKEIVNSAICRYWERKAKLVNNKGE